MSKEKKEAVFYGVIITLFTVICYLYGIGRIYGFTLFPDEFGYWASAASVLGYDWSEIASLGSYYSFGYSLILMPILYLIPDPLTAYRAAVTVNTLLLAGSLFLLYRILKRLLPEETSKQRMLFAGMAICYPTWILYAGMTMTEILLVFTYLLVCALLFRYLETTRFVDLLWTVLAVGYLYVVHLRSVGIVLSIAVTVPVFLISKIKDSRKRIIHIILFLVCLGAAMLLAGYGKRMVQATVYAQAGAERLSTNDYSGQWVRLKRIFSVNGISKCLVSLFGKILYLGMASFGLFYFGMAYAVRMLFDRTKSADKRCAYLFLILASLGTIGVCAIYTKDYSVRADTLLYGRYDEMILPPLMALGCAAFLKWKHPGRLLAGFLTIGIAVTALLTYVAVQYEMTNIHKGYFIAGMSYLLKWVDYRPETYFWQAYALAAGFCLVLYLIFMLIRRNKEFLWILSVAAGLECLLGLSLGEHYTFSYSVAAYGNIQMTERIAELQETVERRVVSYDNHGGDNFISAIQFQMRDSKIYLVNAEDIETLYTSDLVIVNGVHGEDPVLEERFERKEPYGSFWLYYNE